MAISVGRLTSWLYVWITSSSSFGLISPDVFRHNRMCLTHPNREGVRPVGGARIAALSKRLVVASDGTIEAPAADGFKCSRLRLLAFVNELNSRGQARPA